MKNDFEIAPGFKRSDWKKLRDKIKADFNNNDYWEKAYEVLNERITARYQDPIDKIKTLNEQSFSGEGFAIMTILCSLVEFLESLYQGINYKYRRPGEFEYNKSSEIFRSFLTEREPFKSEFPLDKVDDFYQDVRCSLLHEASTGKNWKIRIDTPYLVEERGGAIILNRNRFLEAIKKYIKNYKVELLASKERKEAFTRKFNHLAQIQ